MALKPHTDAEAAARRLSKSVEIDLERLGGEPVFRGTRVPVKSLFDHLSAGDSLETFLDELAHGMSPAEIVKAWDGKITRSAVAESVSLARRSLLDRHGRLRHPDELPAAA